MMYKLIQTNDVAPYKIIYGKCFDRWDGRTWLSKKHSSSRVAHFPIAISLANRAVTTKPARLSPFTIPVESDLNFRFNKSCIIHVIPPELWMLNIIRIFIYMLYILYMYVHLGRWRPPPQSAMQMQYQKESSKRMSLLISIRAFV